MAQIEPMDIDIIDSDFDNKENSFHHSNVLPRTSCTEKGYEELDVSELNMKLRYSITPASSPMSKSFTANCLDNRTFDSGDYVNNVVIHENGNLTRSLNSTITRTYQDINKSLKSLPLKVLSTDQNGEDRSASVLRSLDSSLKTEENNVTLSVENDNVDNTSLPSPSSSLTQTPEATTPTKEIPKHDGGSPIMRGLKSVLNMFRSSQSPIPTPGSHIDSKSEVLSPSDLALKGSEASEPEILLASTPIVNKNKEDSRRCSPLKESIVFNDDLERELQWKDETTILFKEEKIPIHKLFLPKSMSSISKTMESIMSSSTAEHNYDLNASVEYMDISHYSLSGCKTTEDIQPTIISNKNEALAVESDSEFVDCETTLNNDANESNLKEEIFLENNENGNSAIIQYNYNDCFQENSKQSIGNDNMITDLLLTDKGKCEEDKMCSLSEIQKQKADMCHEININKIIQANCELSNTSCGASLENTVDDQSKQALVVKNILTSTVNEVSTLEDENNIKLVSNEITNQISADKRTQYSKIEVKGNKSPETSDSVIMPEGVSNKYNYENEYHNEVRLPSDVPLPDDDFEKDFYSVNPDASYSVCDPVSVGENLNNEHKLMHDLEIREGIDRSELSVTQVSHSNHNIVNNTEFTAEFTKPYEIGMEHKNQPHHVGKEYYSQTIDLLNKITMSEYTEEHKIRETTECLQVDKVRTENIDNNKFEQGLLESEEQQNLHVGGNVLFENQENKPLVDSQQIFSFETSSVDKNILKPKETTFTENKSLENISIGHGVLESNLCSSKNYIIKTTTNQDSNKLGNTVNPSEIRSIHQINTNNCETVLNQKSTAISAMENNFDTNYINATVNTISQFISDNVLSSISSPVQLTESIDKNQLLEKEQNYSSELQIDDITNVVNNESQNVIDINSANMLDSLDVLPAEKFNEDNKVMNSMNMVSACLINQKELNFVQENTKIDSIDIQKNINNLEEIDDHSSKIITISQHEVEQAMTISDKEQDENNFDSLESTEKLETSNINNFADIVGTPKIRCMYEKNEMKSECVKINRNENLDSSNKKTIESLNKEVLNTVTNNPITLASTEEMSVQATSVANTTLNMSMCKEGKYENEDIYIGSESCKDILCECTDVNEIDPQEKNYSVYHQENERVENSPSKSIGIAACDHKKYISNTDMAKEEDFCISKDSIEKLITVCAPSVTEVISQPENITNIEYNISFSNAFIPDILDSTNKNLINENFKNSNEDVKADSNEEELKSIYPSENIEVDVTLQQKNTNDMSSQASRSILVGDCQFNKSGNEEGMIKILANSSLLNSFANKHNLKPEELNEELENVIEPLNTETKTMQSPPLSPNISSKGYNLNFDEINDPFMKDSKQVMTKILENSSFSVSSDENHIEAEEQKEELENMIEPLATNTKLMASPPLSPKISSKGYNLNFDEINDPFVKDSKQVMTKTLENSSFSVSSGENHMEPKEPKEELGNVIEPFATNMKLMASSPLSPKISCKGYNLNFDEINDPFVKDSKQVMSKTLENSSFSVSSGENHLEPEEQKEELGNIIEPFATNTKLMASPPLSPKISSKGYNLNFDEINDPFVKDSKQVITKILKNSSFSVSTDKKHIGPAEEKEELENMIEPFATNTKLMASPPLSPKISSKGYNLNFDEINDPFVKDNKQVMTKILENSSFSVSSGENHLEPEEQKEELENIIESFSTNTKLMASPPLSPKISSKGYNFDESEDPFGTKTKIRMSPPPEGTPTSLPFVGRSSISPKFTKKGLQKLKFLSENKKQPISEIKRNSTFCSAFDFPEMIENSKNIGPVMAQDLIIGDIPVLTSISNKNIHNPEDVTSSNVPARDNLVESVEVTLCQAEKIVSDTENARTNAGRTESSLNEKDMLSVNSFESKNVFNLPEISSEMTFNPFVTKSKVGRSPSPEKKTSMKDVVKVPVENSSHLTRSYRDDYGQNDEDVDNKQTGSVEQDSSIASSSSKATEDATVREVNTEDEDTVEGPFFESDEINNSDKMSDFGTEHDDMMHFSDLPTQGNDDNANENGEIFIDAETFEFLLNQNKSNVVVDSGKESLFLKFDPLFAKRMSSDGVLAALNKVHKRQSTPKRISKVQTVDVTYSNKSSPGTSDSTITTNINKTFEANTEDPNITVSKPMMVVNPAINSIVSPRNKSNTPPRTNRRSLTFTSPAIAVIDRLLSLSGNNSPINHDRTTSEVRREQNETDLALTQLRELLAEKEIHVHNLRSESKELRERLSTLESQVKTLETESEQRLSKVNELNERLTEKTKINKSMAAVVEEYERTIASLIAETEQDKKLHAEERARLINERDEQTAHLASMEISFNDLHSKYEKSKQIILSCKANEDTYKKSIKEFEESLLKMQNNYELLKQHATSKLNHANQELERLNRSHEAEIVKLNAMIKRKELHIISLEETLAQKTKANEELTAICDELINKLDLKTTISCESFLLPYFCMFYFH